jgi:DnaK suppressor protein
MNERNLQQFKKQLNTRLADLLRQADRTVRDLQDIDLRQADALDLAAAESNRNFSLRIRNRENRLIHKIQRSLRDIEEGTYGMCEACGESIGLKRLKARPVTRHCIRCKTEMEKLERLVGN